MIRKIVQHLWMNPNPSIVIEPTASESLNVTVTRLSPEQQRQQQRRVANRLRRCLRKYLTLLKNVITTVVFPTKNSHSLLLAMLLFALFLELLGWFILVGLFTTFLIYLLLIIHLAARSFNLNSRAGVPITTSPKSSLSVWSRKLAPSLCEAPTSL